MAKYYGEPNPVGEQTLNTTEYYRSIIDGISVANKGCLVTITLRYPFPVGAIFHVANKRGNYYIKRRFRVREFKYEIRGCDKVIGPEDLLNLKKGAIIFRTGMYVDPCQSNIPGTNL